MKSIIAMAALASSVVAPIFLVPDTPPAPLAHHWDCPGGRLEISRDGAAIFLMKGQPAVFGRVSGQAQPAKISLPGAISPMPASASLRASANQLLIESTAGENQLCRMAQRHVGVASSR